jgi:prepilin-type N-terminal cleavage/methylation domain-containing protein
MKKQQGFTLIELLVVIAIIGLLSTLAVLSFGGVREKARDAQRINDVRQLALVLEMEETDSPGMILTGCAGGAADAAYALTTTCSNAGDVLDNFPDFSDPSTPATACVGTAGTATSAATCGYSISQTTAANAPTTADYQICFWLESGSNNLAAGLNSITQGANFVAGCV